MPVIWRSRPTFFKTVILKMRCQKETVTLMERRDSLSPLKRRILDEQRECAQIYSPMPRSKVSIQTFMIQCYDIRIIVCPVPVVCNVSAWWSQPWSHFKNSSKSSSCPGSKNGCLFIEVETKAILIIPSSKYILIARDVFRYRLPHEVGIGKEVLSVRLIAALVHCLAYPRKGYKNQEIKPSWAPVSY